MATKCFDYETESGEKTVFPRVTFRNMHQVRAAINFPFNLVERDNNKPYDIYKDPESSALILVIGGDKHCHVNGQLGKYKEGIVIECEEKNKDILIKKISSVL